MTGEGRANRGPELDDVFFVDFSAAERSAQQYSVSELNLVARRDLYKFARRPLVRLVPLVGGGPAGFDADSPKAYYPSSEEVVYDPKILELEKRILDIERVMTDCLPRRGAERILDVGAGSGDYPIWLSARHNHIGEIVAFEQSEGIVEGLKLNLRHNWPDANILVEQGDVNDLHEHFEERSFDIVLAKYLLYHVKYPYNAIEQMGRVLKPGGIMLVSGREVDNMERLWGYSPAIARYINENSPPGARTKSDKPLPSYYAPHPFYLSFNLKNAELYFPQHYQNLGPIVNKKGDLRPYTYSDWLHIPASGREGYFLAALSLAPSFEPEEPPLDIFFEAVNAVVMKEFDEEVSQHGYFREKYRDWFALYRKQRYTSYKPRPRQAAQIQIPDERESDNPT